MGPGARLLFCRGGLVRPPIAPAAGDKPGKSIGGTVLSSVTALSLYWQQNLQNTGYFEANDKARLESQEVSPPNV